MNVANQIEPVVNLGNHDTWKILDKLDRKFFLDVHALIGCPFYSVSYVFAHDSLLQYSPRKELKDTQ